MNPLMLAIDSPLMRVLGWTLIHFLWQGACAGAIYAVLRYLLRSHTPTARYHLAMFTLAVLAVMPVVTLIHLISSVPVAPARNQDLVPFLSSALFSQHSAAQSVSAGATVLETTKGLLQGLAPWAVPFWLFGVMVMSLRVWRGWKQARFLRHTAIFSSLPTWKVSVDRLQDILGIHRVVRLAVSAGVTVPSVIGWLKPIILIPPSVLTGLTPLQMELILAHELAHIRRQDYLWNLLQLFVDTLLFYHPVVRWVSRHARMEREQCCDDIVVSLNGDTLNYARALTELERLRAPRSSMVLGADGGHVIHRIHRLIGMPAVDISPISWALPLLALSLLVTGSLARVPFQYPVFMEHTASVASTPEPDVAVHEMHRAASLQATRVAVNSAAPLEPVHPVAQFETALHATPVAVPDALSHPDTASEETPAVLRTGGTIVARYAPHYPQYSLERGIEGSATVSFILNAAGEVTDAQVIHVQGSRLFGQAAVSAIKHWKFTPIKIDGKSVSQAMTQEFDFRLDSPDATTGTCRIPIGFHICTRG